MVIKGDNIHNHSINIIGKTLIDPRTDLGTCDTISSRFHGVQGRFQVPKNEEHVSISRVQVPGETCTEPRTGTCTEPGTSHY